MGHHGKLFEDDRKTMGKQRKIQGKLQETSGKTTGKLLDNHVGNFYGKIW